MTTEKNKKTMKGQSLLQLPETLLFLYKISKIREV